MLWPPESDRTNAALLPLTECVERAERGNVTQEALFCMKPTVTAGWRALAPNPYGAVPRG
jgi:hypothetical protein